MPLCPAWWSAGAAGAGAAKTSACAASGVLTTSGWVSGTGGGISVRIDDRVFMAPSGVQKEMLQPEWIFELDRRGDVVSGPPSLSGFTVSQCRPLFLAAMNLRGAGAVIHSHSRNAVVATLLAEKLGDSHVTLSHLEMLKGLAGVGYVDVHRVPVIDNTAVAR